jgi:2-keto-4-pentenoate hydratase/2-oxohepta-3-ene-1,7-dioic acid hydratase in catechol pathway
MKAVRFRNPAGDLRIGSLSEDGEIIDAGAAPPGGFVPSREGWEELERASGPRHEVGEVSLLRPLQPGKVLAVGFNYRDHAEESGDVPPSSPMIFAKLPSSLIDPGEPIRLPPEEPEPDFEAELALVIGRRTRRVAVAEALASIGGITAMNDVSGRGAQFGDPGLTWAKGYDTFGPLGPCIARQDPSGWHDLDLTCTVSGELMQKANSADMVFGPLELVSRLSHLCTLEPGDVISTGTPAGVGFAREPARFLRPGDVVEVWVEGVGTLRNPVVSDS